MISLSELVREYRFIKGVIRLTLNERPKKCLKIVDFFKRLCTMGDIATDILRTEQATLPYYVCHLTLRIFLELQASLFQGSYHSAARSLRWLYEANIAVATACINPFLIDERYEGKSELSLEEFEKWLDLYDRHDATLPRKKILEAFGLPTEELDDHYSVLCKYMHISKLSFDKKLDWPKLQYIPEKFDEMFELTIKTMDLVLWMQSKMLLCYNDETAGALKGVLEDWESINEYIPLTVSLLSGLNR